VEATNDRAARTFAFATATATAFVFASASASAFAFAFTFAFASETTSNLPCPARQTRSVEMMEIEWLKPGVFAGSILYALLGVAVFWLCFVIIDKVTPYKLWEEIIEKQNLALAIVVGSMCISIGLIVSAAVQG
jgi:putative membrane protein